MYLANKSVYLSGAIEHGGSYNWRTPVIAKLREEFGLNVFDPFDDPKQQWTPALNKARDECDYLTMRRIAKSFVRKDLCLVDRADLLVAYLPYKVPTTGTIHEIINSSNAKKPTLVVCPQGKQYVSLWLYGFIPHDVMFGSWEELYVYLREVNDGKHKENNRWHFIYGMV